MFPSVLPCCGALNYGMLNTMVYTHSYSPGQIVGMFRYIEGYILAWRGQTIPGFIWAAFIWPAASFSVTINFSVVEEGKWTGWISDMSYLLSSNRLDLFCLWLVQILNVFLVNSTLEPLKSIWQDDAASGQISQVVLTSDSSVFTALWMFLLFYISLVVVVEPKLHQHVEMYWTKLLGSTWNGSGISS